jgi:hypothetical protein
MVAVVIRQRGFRFGIVVVQRFQKEAASGLACF